MASKSTAQELKEAVVVHKILQEARIINDINRDTNFRTIVQITTIWEIQTASNKIGHIPTQGQEIIAAVVNKKNTFCKINAHFFVFYFIDTIIYSLLVLKNE
jgi:hypothetical protein